MNRLLLKYGVILALIQLIGSNIRVVNSFKNITDATMGVFSVIIVIVVLMFTINAYIKERYYSNNKTYSYGEAILVGTAVSVIGSLIFCFISFFIIFTFSTTQYDYKNILNHFIKFSFLGFLVSVIIPLTHRTKEKN